uniref:Secreted protein n=1 Tax=Haemonchus contortus TaxID=6289 RepID=A0A7I4YS30_HAECO
MLGRGSLLVVQFLAIVLFNSPLLEACADCVTLAPGQDSQCTCCKLEQINMGTSLRTSLRYYTKEQVQGTVRRFLNQNYVNPSFIAQTTTKDATSCFC